MLSFQACAWLGVWTYLDAECCRMPQEAGAVLHVSELTGVASQAPGAETPGERLVVFSHCFLRREQGKGTSSVKRALGVMPGELPGKRVMKVNKKPEEPGNG